MHTVLTDTPAAVRPEPGRRRWSRQLGHYPPTRTRLWNLGLVVAITIVFYYQVYVAGAVSTHILRTFGMSFRWYVSMVVVSYALGGLASFCAGLADRYGRANIVIGGLLITSLLTLVGIPRAHSGTAFAAVFIAIGFVEGVCLVATPALIRDFSPQLGRASAMGFWTLGPVAGSLVVSLAVSTSSDTIPWQDQYIRCGLAGLAVWLVALAGLRELAPRLRDQLMVSAWDRALIEARAKGIDVKAALRRPFRQVLKLNIVGSAFAIAVFLIMYYLAVGFLPVFFQTVFGFSQSTASSLGNWFWAGQAVALVVTGVVSDRLRVRKPFMLIGAIGAVITTTVFALRATQHATSYQTFAVLLTLLAVCIGITYAPWMASFTETVERRNPALTATGLAAWGMIVRLVVAVSIVVLPHVVTTATTLAQDGPRVQAAVTGTDPALTAAQNATVKAVAAQPAILAKARSLAAAYAPELATAAKLSPAAKTALVADPASRTAQGQALSEISGLPLAIVAQVIAVQHTGAGASLPASGRAVPHADAAKVQAAAAQLRALTTAPAADLAFLHQYALLKDPKVLASLAYLKTHAPGVKKALADSPRQWQSYFWVAAGGQLAFIPLIFLMAGFWDPRRARRQQTRHEAWVNAELARLQPEQANA